MGEKEVRTNRNFGRHVTTKNGTQNTSKKGIENERGKVGGGKKRMFEVPFEDMGRAWEKKRFWSRWEGTSSSLREWEGIIIRGVQDIRKTTEVY